MRIPEFQVDNHRTVERAACDKVPRVMIVTGPNGCGKSTLLDGLRWAPGPHGPILYVGPHRTSGRQTVQMQYLFQQKVSMRQLQAGNNLPSVQGVNIHSQQRSAWDFDETSNYLKYALCQVELDRQTAVTDRFDRDGEIDQGDIPDIWEPLKEMTKNLLPHLHFHKIDVSNRDGVRCLWKVHTKNLEVDIDDLSSGEKAIIQLFFPLIENRIQARIEQSKGAEHDVEDRLSEEEVCVLMDEPELHLHPNLQGKILDYIRNLAVKEQIQFIIATHSQTIVERASSDELYLLRPAELVQEQENQLLRVATNEEKLNLMRDTFGSTSNITAMRNILVVEGKKAGISSKHATDERVFSFLSDRFAQVTIFSGGSKGECIKLAQVLNELLSRDLSNQLRAFALVDRDLTENESTRPNVITLPVSMIENFLVDPQVLWEAISLVRHKTSLHTLTDIDHALDGLLNDLHAHEVQRRVRVEVGFFKFSLKAPITETKEQVENHIRNITSATSEDRINNLTAEAEEKNSENL